MPPLKPPRRAAYALPTLFTAANIFLGFLSISQTFQAALQTAAGDISSAAHNFDLAAIFIGIAVATDGLDGRIARMTGTVSDFGREMDSLADVITFGLAPAMLAFVWGVYFVGSAPVGTTEHLRQAGYFLSFMFLLCGAMRLARFNITTSPVLKNPGRPDRKYFAGLAIPAAAGMLAAVVYFRGTGALTTWAQAVAWLGLMALLAFLMVSTWRYRSFKDLNLLHPRSPVSILLMGAFIYGMWNYSRIALLTLGTVYVSSGVLVRIAGLIKRVRARRA